MFFQCDEVNEAGCNLVTAVAKEFGTMIGLPITTTRSYQAGLGKEKVQEEFRKQLSVFDNHPGDLVMAEVCIMFFRSYYPCIFCTSEKCFQ